MKNTKMSKGYEVDFAEEKITITKAFGKLASTVDSNEYKLFNKLRKDNPAFTIEYKEFKVSPTKDTYKGATIDFMKKCVLEKYDQAAVDEVEKVVKLYKDHPAYYGKVKAFVFRNYKECKELMKKTEKEEEPA